MFIARTQQILAKDINKLRNRKLSALKPLKEANNNVLAHQRKLVNHNTILSIAERSAADSANTDESREVLRGNDWMREGLEVQNEKASNDLSIINRRNRAFHCSRIVSIKSLTKSQNGRVCKWHIKQSGISRRAICEDLEGMVDDIGHKSTGSNRLTKGQTENASWSCSSSSRLSRDLSVHHDLSNSCVKY